MEKITKYLPTPLILLAFMLAMTTLLSADIPLFKDPDISWHIIAGYDIRERGWWPPKYDPWSFTEKMQAGGGQVWYNISWVWDIALSFIHQAFGMEGVFIFAKFLPATVVIAQLYFLWKRGKFGNNALIFSAIITTYCMMEDAYGRPQVFGVLLALFFHHFLHLSRDVKNRKKTFILPLLMILWVNIHGSFFMAFAALGAFGLEAIYKKDWVWLKHLLIVSVLCVLAISINPQGIFIITGILRTMKSVLTDYIVEWRPFVFGHIMGATMWLGVYLYVSNLRGSDAPLADKILAIVFLFVTLLAVRNASFLAAYGAPYLAANMPPDNEKDKHTRQLARWINNKKYSLFVAPCVPLFLVIVYVLLPFLGKEYYYEKAKESPLPAIEYVLKNYPNSRVLNDYNVGGRLIYESKGKFPIFIDGRAGTAYSEDTIKDYLKLVDSEPDFMDVVKKYNVDVMLLMKTMYFVTEYKNGKHHDEWEEVYKDSVAAVYVRKKDKKN